MVDSGVPQGSVLGPILFLIYVDDAARDLECEVAMFADDMKIWSVIRGPVDEDRLQMNLNRLEEWSNRWLLRFNVAKCSILRLGNTARSASTRGYFVGGAALQEVEAQKDLVVLTTSSLKPSTHCSRVAKSAKSVLYAIKRGQIRRYKDTLKSSLKRLHINPTNWEELARDRPTWRRTVKAGAAIYEAHRIAAAKVKREVRKSQLRPIRNAAAQALPTCPRCQRTFRTRIGLVGHLRTNCTSRTAPAIVPAPASSSSSLPPTNSDTPSAPPLPSSSFSSTAPAVAVQAAVSHIANHDTATATTPTCPHCDRTFTSHNGLAGHLRIHRTETGEPVPGAPTYTHRTRLHCPQCPRTFRHRMGLFGHMRIHESGIDRSLDTPTPPSPTPNPSPCAPTNHSPADIDATDLTTPHSPPSSSTSSFTATTTATPASVANDFTTAAPDTKTGTTPATSINRCEGPDFVCPHCDRTFTSRIGLLTPTPPTSHAHIAHAPSPHASAWSVTCESIAQRLANQCLEHQPTPTALASTAHITLAPSRIAWDYSATCASTTTCGRQPPATPHIPSLPTS
nr:unnamed protein product [Spirometra erinaceieuropaei]